MEFALLLAVVLLTGCGTAQDLFIVDRALIDNEQAASDAKGLHAPPPINLDLFVFLDDFRKEVVWDSDKEKLVPKNPDNGEGFKIAYGKAVNDPANRNRLQDVIMNRSEQICTHHKGAILANSAVFNFSTSLLSTILSSVSAVVGGEVAKSAISTASASVNAAGTAVKAEFYQNLLAAAIVNKIVQTRATIKQGLIEKRKLSIKDYSVDQAIGDAYLYHTACSFYEGLVGLTKDKEAPVKTREDIDKEIDALKKESEALRTKLAIPTGTAGALNADDQRAARVQIDLNNARILGLMQQRATAPGAVSAGAAGDGSAGSGAAGDGAAGDGAAGGGATGGGVPAGKVTPGEPVPPPQQR
ncbi:hypothetical protein RJ527_15845 [Thalassospiraceae bacterium LMO-SO8]|nr:hypothetical protein [Alphaproteobacteria bacterium LMO-S08]WND75496.1 hypothetical protein RJ527_15845 [Thalassospiraceae bacterium LMO-SO8]